MRLITLSVEYDKIDFDRMPAKLWGNHIGLNRMDGPAFIYESSEGMCKDYYIDGIWIDNEEEARDRGIQTGCQGLLPRGKR
jgi:hypothetical protein